MNFNDYQLATQHTAIYPKDDGLYYVTMGLTSEAGEVAGKVKKSLRDEGGVITPQRRESILSELGDVLWYCARIAEELDADLDEVAELNIMKLADRKERGAISGDGDKR